MKLIWVSVIFYIEAVLYETIIYFVMRMKRNGSVTSVFARKAERMGERLYRKAKYIEMLFNDCKE